MSIKPFLGSNTGVQDIFFFGTQLSPFAYKGWTTSTNFMIERKDYDPINTTAFNNTITFQYPQDTDLAGPPAIVIQLPRIAVNANSGGTFTQTGGSSYIDPATGTYRVNVQSACENHRYIEGAGLHAIEKIDIVYGSNLLQTIKPEDLELRANLYEQQETLQYTKELMGWYGSSHASDRGSTAEDALLRTYVIHLPTVFWGISPNQWLPVFLLKDVNNLRIHVKLRDWASIVTYDVASNQVPPHTHIQTLPTGVTADGNTPLSVRLRCVNVHLTAFEKDYFVQLAGSRGTREGTEDDGLLYKFQDIERHEREVVAAGSPTKVLKLSNFRSPTTQLIFILRPQAKVDSKFPYTASAAASQSLALQRQDPTQASYEGITYNKITANGMDLCREQHWRDTTLSEMLLYYPNGFKKDIYVRVFNDLTPTDELNCVGSINFMNLNNPQLELKWSTNELPAQACYLDVYAKVHQVIQLVNGQLHKLFN
jgi:hypothetical protein